MVKMNICEPCKYETKYKQDYNKHLKTKHHLLKVNGGVWEQKTHKCKKCDYETTKKPDMKKHIERMHNDKLNVKYICLACESYIESERNRIFHIHSKPHKRNLILKRKEFGECVIGGNVNNQIAPERTPLYIKSVDLTIKKEDINKVDKKVIDKFIKENDLVTDEDLLKQYKNKLRDKMRAIYKKYKSSQNEESDEENDESNEEEQKEDNNESDEEPKEEEKELQSLSNDDITKDMFINLDYENMKDQKQMRKLVNFTMTMLKIYDKNNVYDHILTMEDVKQEYKDQHFRYQKMIGSCKKCDAPDYNSMINRNYNLCKDLMTDDILLKRLGLKW